MDRSHLIKSSSEPCPESRQAEIREIDRPVIEIKDDVVSLILDLQVIEKRLGGEVPFGNIEIKVKVDGEVVAGVITDESGQIEKKRVNFERGKSFVTITIPGTTALYRRKIAEIASRDFDEEKRIQEEAKKRAEEEEKEAQKRAEEALRRKAEKDAQECFETKVGGLYVRWFEFAVHRFMIVERKKYLKDAVLDLDSRVESANAKIVAERKKINEYEQLLNEEGVARKKLADLCLQRDKIIENLARISEKSTRNVDDIVRHPHEYSKTLREMLVESQKLCRYQSQKAKKAELMEFDVAWAQQQQVDQDIEDAVANQSGIEAEVDEACRGIYDFYQCASFDINYDNPIRDAAVIQGAKEFLHLAKSFVRQFEKIAEGIQNRLNRASQPRIHEDYVRVLLDEAVEIFSEIYSKHTCWGMLRAHNSLKRFFPEFECPISPEGIWPLDFVTKHLRGIAQCNYSQSVTIECWDRFKTDISSYLGLPLEETEFYKEHQEDFEAIEQFRDRGKIDQLC